MLSKHGDRCRFPHGHTRTIEVVVSASQLDENGMVLDFKALKLALKEHIDRYDHTMAVNSEDPLLAAMQEVYPESVVVFENREPTTEAIAEELFAHVQRVLTQGWQGDGYSIRPGSARVERVRVWETPTSWAEVGP